MHVPAQSDWIPPASHAVQTYEVRQAHGLLWVRLHAPSADAVLPDVLQLPPAFAPGTDAEWRKVVCGPYAVATSAGRLVENFLDMSHFSFVHQAWLGDANHPQVDVGQVEETTSGITVSHARAWQPKAYASATDGQMVDYRYDVLAPWTATLHKDATTPDGPRNAIALFINPVGPEECNAWFVMATQNDPTPDDDLRRFQDAVFAQDRPVVESQTPRRLPIRPVPPALPVQSVTHDLSAASDSDFQHGLPHHFHHAREVHGPADRLSAAYRRYLNRLGVGFGVC
jgi:phenylpropionate dioxygenase-like ring-hydroxylating dioxygenase large terminal subunit